MSTVTIAETPVEITLGPIEVTVAISSTEAAIAIANDGPEITVTTTESTLTIGEVVVATVIGSASVEIVTVAQQGPQGVPGEPVGSTIEYLAGETISALKVVVVIGDETFVADSSNSAHRGRVAGIATTAATIGNTGEVRSFGQMTDASWNWTGPLLFFNSSGTLTETPPASGFSQSVARVESADTIFVDLTQAIERA